MEWETVIGLEVHVQLATKSKLFSGSSTAYGAEPNTQANAVDLGLPGVLPVFNQEALDMALQFGLAIGAKINKKSIFARKNYFYPDLPKGYQTTQMDLPTVDKGRLDIQLENDQIKTIGITRAHIEEDAGKSLHDFVDGMTGIDLNRAGTPLLEIVSEPDMRNAKEAVAYLKAIHSIIRYLKISDGNMAEGSMRCDVNISIRPKGQLEFGTRTELKNINSFKFVEKAINGEVERQIIELEEGRDIIQETRLYDANKNETRSMRSKEEANDYRYFPCPDLLPVVIEDDYLETLKKSLPELPDEKHQRFIRDFNLSDYDARVLSANRATAEFFEAVNQEINDPKLSANWVMGELSAALNKDDKDIETCPITPQNLGLILKRLKDDTVSGKGAKTVFEHLWKNPELSIDQIIKDKGLEQVSDLSAIEAMVDAVIANNPKQVEQYRSSPEEKQKKLIGFFVGQVMKASKGSANPGAVNKILSQKL